MATEQSLSETPTVSVGGEAPDFTLRSGSGETITLSQYRGSKNCRSGFLSVCFQRDLFRSDAVLSSRAGTLQ